VDQKIVVFQGDRKVLLGDMVRILGIAKEAHAEQIAIAAKRVTGAQLQNSSGGGS
jgi:biopolymer transport protein ExbD